jgi:hypothetical protein
MVDDGGKGLSEGRRRASPSIRKYLTPKDCLGTRASYSNGSKCSATSNREFRELRDFPEVTSVTGVDRGDMT